MLRSQMCPMPATPVIWKVKQMAGVLGEGRVAVTLPAAPAVAFILATSW